MVNAKSGRTRVHLLTPVVPSFFYVFPIVLMIEELTYFCLTDENKAVFKARVSEFKSIALYFRSHSASVQLPSVKCDISIRVDKIPVHDFFLATSCCLQPFK